MVYLLHFNTRYKHAGHYLGSTCDLEARLRCMPLAVERACCTSCRPRASPGAWRAPGLVAKRKNASSKSSAAPAATARSARRHAVLTVTKYPNSRFWAV